MKKLWKVGFVLLLLILASLIIHKTKEKELKEYMLNKELRTIKSDWRGNLKIDGEFVNFDEKDEQKTPLDIF